MILTNFPKNMARDKQKKTIQRINEFMAAESLNDINILRAPGLHSLSGKQKGLWAVY